MNASIDVLFQPFTLGNLVLKNRIVMAPMTRNMAPGGIPGPDNAAYYRRRAEGEVGLILSEGTVVNRPASRNEPNIPLFHGEPALAGWKSVIDAVHAAGGRMGPQIWHTGATRGQGGWTPAVEVESPSGLLAPGNPRGKAMSEADIADTIAAFAAAAGDAKALGFDVVELHGAHGYLIDEFFWPGTNHRTDEWGGDSIEARSRFAVSVVSAVRKAVGPGFPVIIRVSQWRQQDYASRLAETPDEMARWLQPLVDAGASMIHASQRRFWEAEFPEVDGEKGLNFAGWAKKLTGMPTISVGSVGLSSDFFGAFAGESSAHAPLDSLLERLGRDEFDLIAVGRALLNDASWVQKIAAGDTEHLRDFDAASLAELV